MKKNKSIIYILIGFFLVVFGYLFIQKRSALVISTQQGQPPANDFMTQLLLKLNQAKTASTTGQNIINDIPSWINSATDAWGAIKGLFTKTSTTKTTGDSAPYDSDSPPYDY